MLTLIVIVKALLCLCTLLILRLQFRAKLKNVMHNMPSSTLIMIE